MGLRIASSGRTATLTRSSRHRSGSNYNRGEERHTEEKIILYSTGCPRCDVLKRKLDSKGVSYEENRDTDAMRELGIRFVPMLAAGDRLMGFAEAVRWVNQL